MIRTLLKTAMGGLGLAGGIGTPWLMLGAVVAVLAVLGGTWKAGYNYANTQCEAAAVTLENNRLKAAIEEKDRQVDAVNRIQRADSERANVLSRRNQELEGKDVQVQIVCDPAPVDPPAGVRKQPVGKGVRDVNPKHTVSPERRGTLRRGTGSTGDTTEPERSEPVVEPRPGFAR